MHKQVFYQASDNFSRRAPRPRRSLGVELGQHQLKIPDSHTRIRPLALAVAVAVTWLLLTHSNRNLGPLGNSCSISVAFIKVRPLTRVDPWEWN